MANGIRMTAQQVNTLLSVGTFVAQWATGSRDLSRALNVLRKIYRRNDNGVLTEIRKWYQCSWCSEVLEIDPTKGSAPMTRHISGCDRRPDNYVLPAQNLHLRNRNAPMAPNANPANQVAPAAVPQNPPPNANVQANAPGAAVIAPNVVLQNQPGMDAPNALNANEHSQPAAEVVQRNENLQNEEQSDDVEAPVPLEFVDVDSMIPIAQLPTLLARANAIGAMYGRVTAAEFETILPDVSGQLPADFEDRAKAFAFARLGVKRPRIILNRIDKVAAVAPVPAPTPPPSKKEKKSTSTNAAGRRAGQRKTNPSVPAARRTRQQTKLAELKKNK